jgi:hypothetical protein
MMELQQATCIETFIQGVRGKETALAFSSRNLSASRTSSLVLCISRISLMCSVLAARDRLVQ